MYLKNAKEFFIKGIFMMILTFRDELSTRIRIREKNSRIRNPAHDTWVRQFSVKEYLLQLVTCLPLQSQRPNSQVSGLTTSFKMTTPSSEQMKTVMVTTCKAILNFYFNANWRVHVTTVETYSKCTAVKIKNNLSYLHFYSQQCLQQAVLSQHGRDLTG